MNGLEMHFSGKLSGLNRVGSVGEGIDCIARLFQEPANVQKRIGENLNDFVRYEWESPEGQKKALGHVKAMLCALDLGKPKQAYLQCRQAEDLMFFDYSNKAIRLAKDAGLSLKPLAKLDGEPSGSFTISGPKHDWIFRDLDRYGKAVPANVLLLAQGIQSLGLRWHQSFVGEPHVPQAVPQHRMEYFGHTGPTPFVQNRPRPYGFRLIDPILAISFDRWLLEVARWE